jgi:polysaccharide export outer membrane protein
VGSPAFLRVFPATLLLIALIAVGGPGCATVTPKYDYAAEPDPRKQEYVIGTSDVLRITVWHNIDLTGDAVVRPDGTISLPLIGDVKAAGRTPGDVRTEITARLSAFIKDQTATVTVAVSTINSYRFVISGNVERGGAFTANHFVTVSEAVALAGGPNRYASPEEPVITRVDAAGSKRRIPINYPAILKGTHPEHDLPLLAGDTIYVP